VSGIPKFVLYGCGHRAKTPIHARRVICPICRDRRDSADDRARRRDEAERHAAAVSVAHRIAALVAWAHRRDQDVPLGAWGTR
jgi:hypothetical protein